MERNFSQLENNKPSERLPVVFIGHGNPMNAIWENEYTKSLKQLSKDLPRPQTILCISAHWMTEGAWITNTLHPRTIHDFFGFPQELFDVQYPSPGQPEMAEHIMASVKGPRIHPDHDMWGIDHGTWAVMRHMYPEADIPVLQLSLYMSKSPEYHYELGQLLRQFRSQGVLIIGSGNIVHNLDVLIRTESAKPYDWAIEFDQWVKDRLEDRNYDSIVKDAEATHAGRMSIPARDHWYPLLYTLGASDEKDELKFIHEGIDNGSISMRCLTLG
jgi:4,5-DOPA dioxygenase extradiol